MLTMRVAAGSRTILISINQCAITYFRTRKHLAEHRSHTLHWHVNEDCSGIIETHAAYVLMEKNNLVKKLWAVSKLNLGARLGLLYQRARHLDADSLASEPPRHSNHYSAITASEIVEDAVWTQIEDFQKLMRGLMACLHEMA